MANKIEAVDLKNILDKKKSQKEVELMQVQHGSREVLTLATMKMRVEPTQK